MSETRVPHRCARNARCSNRVRVEHSPDCPCSCHGQSALDAQCDIEGGCGSVQTDVVFEGGPIINQAGLCEGCIRSVIRALEELPLDYTELHFLLASGESGITSDVVMGSSDLKVPIRVSIEALQASMVHEVQAWAEPLAEKLYISWDTSVIRLARPGWILQKATNLLANSMTMFLLLPEQEYRYAMDAQWVTRDGIGGALELLRMHDLVRFAAGKTKLIHELPTPCPRCDRKTMVRHNGTDHVTCETCALRWPEAQYKRLCLVMSGDYEDVELDHSVSVWLSRSWGTVGSAAGGTDIQRWRMPMVDLTEGDEPAVAQLVAEFVARCESEIAA
jgi:hypothetical protein